MISFVFFFTNFLCFLFFGLCLGGTIYFYIENTIIGQDLVQDVSIIIIFPVVFFSLWLFTCIGCILKNRCMLLCHIIIVGVMLGGSIGVIYILNFHYIEDGLFLVMEQVLGTRLAYKMEFKILFYILFYGIPSFIFINLIMACIMLFQSTCTTDMNETHSIEPEGSYDDIYNDSHQNPQNENPPTNPYYFQELTSRMENNIPISNQDERVHQQVHTSLSLQEPPSYHEAVIMDIQSAPEETSFQRGNRSIQPLLPQEAPPPYQLWMLRVSKRLKRTGSKFSSKNV